MPSYNRVVLVGNLVNDPKLTYTKTGKPVCNFSLAVQRMQYGNKGEKPPTDFLNIIAWAKLAEICTQYLQKGKCALVEGKIQTRTYETPEGVKKYVFEIIASDMKMLSPREYANSQRPQEPREEEPEFNPEEVAF